MKPKALKKVTRPLSLLLLLWMVSGSIASGQSTPRGALLRSLVLPGWGHHYAQPESWTAGKVHLVADAALLAAYFGYDLRASDLETTLITQAKHYSGAELDGRPRSFRFAVADYESLAAYNDAQLRTRNWNRVLSDTPENQWSWQDEASRKRFVSLINQEAAASDQLPAIVSMMVVNRVLAGVGAYRRASSLSVTTGIEAGNPSLRLRVDF
jgi:hypothetical protein